MKNEINSTSIEEIQSEYRKNPTYRKAERRIRLYLNIASDIIQKRIQKHLTQTELAEAAGTHQSRISKIESGDHDLRISTLINIAEALNCDISFSFCPIEDFSYVENNYSYEDVPQINASQFKGKEKESFIKFINIPQIEYQEVSQ